MKEEIVGLTEDISQSRLYSEDLAPVSAANRTWNTWALAALWIGMAVCIPTYILASYMIRSGLDWVEALAIIVVANLIITIPMVLNGHAGVKYGIPFPVLGRASFGINGIHVASVVRAIVACGWFGVQTWIGGLAIYAIFCAVTGVEASFGLSIGKFLSFGIFWVINMYVVWQGSESIKWLEEYSAPILIGIGIALIAWGAIESGGFNIVLKQNGQLENPAVQLLKENNKVMLSVNRLTDKTGEHPKADAFSIQLGNVSSSFVESEWEYQTWYDLHETTSIDLNSVYADGNYIEGETPVQVVFKKDMAEFPIYSSVISVSAISVEDSSLSSKLWQYILWLTAMVGFWATMSISISDITRYAESQKSQILGQFLGLPGTMMLYSFVGVFVTCAAIINFDDILIANDAPWDPVSLLAKFQSPVVVVLAQFFMLIATLSTNIAANVIAPANVFSNLFPKKISFRIGGIITGIIGILICPWWLLDEISGILIFISGLLGPVLGVMIADYFLIRKTEIKLSDLYKEDGEFAYGGSGINYKAMIALAVGVFTALIGYWVPALNFLYSLSWFTGFFLSFSIYYLLMKKSAQLT